MDTLKDKNELQAYWNLETLLGKYGDEYMFDDIFKGKKFWLLVILALKDHG